VLDQLGTPAARRALEVVVAEAAGFRAERFARAALRRRPAEPDN
jgi:hypothetical protein